MSEGEVRVVPTDLRLSASKVDVHADDLRMKHGSADGRIEAAQRGVPASSAAVLGTVVEKWQTDSANLFGQMVEHSTGLHSGAAVYDETDTQAAADLDAAGDQTTELDLGL